MTPLSRILLVLGSALLITALPLPLWNIRLTAPQYPEGLGMVIQARTVRGATEHDLGNINELNHYIGMKTIEPDEIPELRVIPWLIVGLAALGLGAAALGRRAGAYVWVISFAALGVVGLWDFRRWEYAYGHDLDVEHAIIKIPGMSYQPPLLGSKQLLNFTASSWPAIGSALLGLAFVLGVAAIVTAAPRPRYEVAR
jgi:copper chaperone NosL